MKIEDFVTQLLFFFLQSICVLSHNFDQLDVFASFLLQLRDLQIQLLNFIRIRLTTILEGVLLILVDLAVFLAIPQLRFKHTDLCLELFNLLELLLVYIAFLK